MRDPLSQEHLAPNQEAGPLFATCFAGKGLAWDRAD